MSLYELEGTAPHLVSNDCWVAPTASLIGRIELEALSSVWFGAVLRGDNETIRVGHGSNVQDLSVLHTDMGFPLTIGENCTIGHNVVLHGCTIGSNSLVGIGAVILNGTRIGRNCIIGARTFIAENKTIPDNSMVLGTPGRVVRQVGDEESQKLTDAARLYVRQWRRYAAGLKSE